jgi:hyaluronan synthase
VMEHEYEIPAVKIRQPAVVIIFSNIMLIFVFLALRHLDIIATHPAERIIMYIWSGTFAVSIIQLYLSWRDRPITVSPEQQERLDRMFVTINIPVYNEDPELIDRALFALFRQTRLPNRVQVVDDGSAYNYEEIINYWQEHHPVEVNFSWVRQENRGKRHAQARTFRDEQADIFITLDSDTALEREAIAEGLKPFSDPRILSVAGLELAFNQNRNWLTRTNGSRQLGWQLGACSAQSVMGSVLVNRGTFALYRAAIVRDVLDSYLAEDFFGRNVRFGDDSFLTTYSLNRGRCVQQSSAIQLTVYPENIDHHLRQWARWMRSSTIRSFWRIRYLPLASYGWWTTVINLWLFFASTVASIVAILMWPVAHELVLDAIAAPVIWMYLSWVRNFIVKRSDETFEDQLVSFILAPVAFAWLLFVLKPIRVWGMATCWRTGWGTRSKVEVGLAGN